METLVLQEQAGWNRFASGRETIPLAAIHSEEDAPPTNWYLDFLNRRRREPVRYESDIPLYQPEDGKGKLPRAGLHLQDQFMTIRDRKLAIEREWIGLTGRKNYSEYDVGTWDEEDSENDEEALLSWPEETLLRRVARIAKINPDEGLLQTILFRGQKMWGWATLRWERKKMDRLHEDILEELYWQHEDRQQPILAEDGSSILYGLPD